MCGSAQAESSLTSRLSPISGFFLKNIFHPPFWDRCVSFNYLDIGQTSVLNHKVLVIGGGAVRGRSGRNFWAYCPSGS